MAYTWAVGERERVIAQAEGGKHSPQDIHLLRENEQAALSLRGFDCPDYFILGRFRRRDGQSYSAGTYLSWEDAFTAARKIMAEEPAMFRVTPLGGGEVPIEAVLSRWGLEIVSANGVPGPVWPNGRLVQWVVFLYGDVLPQRFVTSEEAHAFAAQMKRHLCQVYPI